MIWLAVLRVRLVMRFLGRCLVVSILLQRSAVLPLRLEQLLLERCRVCLRRHRRCLRLHRNQEPRACLRP